MDKIVFAASRPFTLGVELEFQLIDRQSFDLVARAPELLAHVPKQLRSRVAPEFIQSILEVQTGICPSVLDVANDLHATVPLLEELAAEKECLLYSASLHPFAQPVHQKLSNGERYQRIMEELQYVGRQFISQGLHVHVGIEDREAVIPVCSGLQIYLPLLLALSASSPYFRGEDTGFCSYRTKLFEALPLAGLAGYLATWQEYEDEIALLKQAQVIREIRDLWWDVRPSPGFGTVEVRICDLPARFVEILGLTSLIQALSLALVEGRIKPQRVSLQILRCNKWQAARHGLEGRFYDPLGFLGQGTMDIRRAVDLLLARLLPCFDTLSAGWLDAVQDLLDHGTSADRQRRLMEKHGEFTVMIDLLQQGFWQGLNN